MDEKRREEKEALKALTEYSPRLIASMKAVINELRIKRQADTDEYLDGIIKGMNWEIQVLNATMEYLNEEETLIDKTSVNDMIIAFSDAYKSKDDSKMADQLEQNIIPIFEKLEEAARVKMV